METTLTAIKADIGSVGGHLTPTKRLLDQIDGFIATTGKDLIHDYYIGYTGDDIAILLTHERGLGNAEIHRLAWEAFKAGTEIAREQGLYGAGQDLLKDAFSGNVRGMGPGVAELTFEERKNEPFLLFTADKTEPGAYNLPLYLAFSDPMYNAGLILSPTVGKGFTFTVMDVENTDKDRIIKLSVPEDTYDLAALLRDNGRFVVESIHSRATGEQAVSCSTTRLRNIAGKYVGKDDPAMLIRTQKSFPATGEVLSPFSIGHLVAGFMRGSHTGPLMPVKARTGVSFFDGPPIVSCLAFCVHNGKLTEPADVFDHPYWDWVRNKVAQKAEAIRQQGFSGPAMLPFPDLEYGGITDRMEKLEGKFRTRPQ
ncbi:MAG: fructose-1,6-bisphosphate aldolase/phosphatase [Candidatus Bipolaricaulota bacterium]|nr:fructose-1,6-bisphosphate aldolase/phosphatase [Candidatus Bipolaricaulota bacterium]